MSRISVDADALRQVLQALSGPGHYIRELQVTRNLDELLGTANNPINLLAAEYNQWAQDLNQNSYDNAAMSAELKWVKDVLAEHIGYDGPLAPAACPLEDWMKQHITYREMFNEYLGIEATLREKIRELETRLANQEQHVRTARDHAEKCHSIMLGYLPKIVQLMALLKRARVDVNYSFQMNSDLERHQVFTPEDSVSITEAADKYQEFLDEIDAALWVPPTEGEQS